MPRAARNQRFWSAADVAADWKPWGAHYWNATANQVHGAVDPRGDDSKVVADAALAFLGAHARALAVAAFHAPHLPVVAPPEQPGGSAFDRAYGGALASLDAAVGRLADHTRATKKLFLFFSDNGPENGTPGSAAPFRGRKRSLLEGGVRVPALLAYDGLRGALALRLSSSDVLPTFVELATGVALRGLEERPFDGESFADALDALRRHAAPRRARRRPLGFEYRDQKAWIDGDEKLVVANGADPLDADRRIDERVALYDLRADPGEARDLAAARPEQAKVLPVPSLLRRWALPRRVSGVVRRRALALFHATGDGSRAMTWRTKGVSGAPRRGVGKLSHIYHDAPSQPTTRPRGVLATTPMRPTSPRRSVAARSTASANSRNDAGAPWRARTGTRRAVGLRDCAAASWADSSQTSRSDGVREYSKCLRPGQESGCCVMGPDETGPRAGGGAGGSCSDGAATGPSRWYRAAGVRKCLRAVGSPAACVGAAPAWVGAPRASSASRRLVPPWRGGGGASAGSRRRAPRPSQPAASSASTPSWATSESTDCLPNDWPATTRRAGLRLLYWRSAGVRVKSSFHAGRAAMMSVL